MESFIYDEIEVKATGRTATKALPGGKSAQMHEITPINEEVGTWKKWVNLVTLFKIDNPSS